MSATAISVRRIRSDELLPVNNIDGNGLSLLDVFYGFLAQAIVDGAFDDTTNELLVNILEAKPSGRTVLMQHESGYYGSNGRIRSTAGATTYEFGSDEAPVIPKRSLLIVPDTGEYAVCLDQRIGAATLPPFFWAELRRAVRHHHGVLVDIAKTADAPAWEEFLDEAEALKSVTYIQRPEDLADGKSVPQGVAVRKYAVEGDHTGGYLPLDLLPLIRRRDKKKNRKAADRMVLLPEDFGPVSALNAKVEVNGKTRTVDVLADDYPTFIYEFSTKGEEPSETVFVSEARDVGSHLLVQNLDCTLDGDWRAEEWSDERLQARLTRKVDDDVVADGDDH